jgi:DNA-binding CsgD family transcriptional regulator
MAGTKEGLLASTELLGNFGSWEWSPGDDHLVWSDNMFRILGLEPGEIEPSIDFLVSHIHPSDRARFEAGVETGRASGSAGDMIDYRFVRDDGEVRHLRGTTQQVDEDGERRMIGLIVDRTEQRRAEREIAAHIAVAEALGSWTSLDEHAPRLLAGLADALSLERGVLWVPSEGALRPLAVWQSPHEDRRGFADDIAELALPRGVGVAGRAWETGRPVVIADITTDESYAFQDSAKRDELRGAVAIPATHDAEVLAVIGLAGHEYLDLTDRLRDSLVGIGGEIGEFLSRHRGQIEPPVLTPRETEILELVSAGLSGPAIAERLVIAPTTVKTHLENIYAKLGTGERANAVAEAMRRGLIR